MKPLAEIVAELERRIGGNRTRSMEKTVPVNEIELSRLLAAFRAAEKMRNSCYGDNSGGEYRPKCSDCEADMHEKHSDTCSFKEWDRVTGGNEVRRL